jgi:hypothetical protein
MDINAICFIRDIALRQDFDAVPWFTQASYEDILALATAHWGD